MRILSKPIDLIIFTMTALLASFTSGFATASDQQSCNQNLQSVGRYSLLMHFDHPTVIGLKNSQLGSFLRNISVSDDGKQILIVSNEPKSELSTFSLYDLDLEAESFTPRPPVQELSSHNNSPILSDISVFFNPLGDAYFLHYSKDHHRISLQPIHADRPTITLRQFYPEQNPVFIHFFVSPDRKTFVLQAKISGPYAINLGMRWRWSTINSKYLLNEIQEISTQGIRIHRGTLSNSGELLTDDYGIADWHGVRLPHLFPSRDFPGTLFAFFSPDTRYRISNKNLGFTLQLERIIGRSRYEYLQSHKSEHAISEHLAWSRDGRFFVTKAGPQGRILLIWMIDPSTGSLHLDSKISTLTHPAFRASFGADEKTLILMDNHGQVSVWQRNSK